MTFVSGKVCSNAIVFYNRLPKMVGYNFIITATGQVAVQEFLEKVKAADKFLRIPKKLIVVTGFHGDMSGGIKKFFKRNEIEEVLNAAESYKENAHLIVFTKYQKDEIEGADRAWVKEWNYFQNSAEYKSKPIPQEWLSEVHNYGSRVEADGVFYTWCDSQCAMTEKCQIDGYNLNGSFIDDEDETESDDSSSESSSW
ncbi:MAG: hypothetical protein F6K18_12380 [Okeania sp. SIO2C2]|uniref:hypothetical protein n=1 Tax=Okeania sp. SIO2C2 TaxID=2607787 RepID=UPI0013BCD5E4|nr:hypothetical protein [Okeania sp. SIO2C2]NEP87552.1 hypothetical protein [Okeania sp. SIO2C2]